jgi:hypothetical protein
VSWRPTVRSLRPMLVSWGTGRALPSQASHSCPCNEGAVCHEQTPGTDRDSPVSRRAPCGLHPRGIYAWHVPCGAPRMGTRLILASVSLSLSALSVGCGSSSSSSDVADARSDNSVGNQPDADMDASSQGDGALPPEGGDASPIDAGHGGDEGGLCADDAGIFDASPGTCNGAPCAPGCACIVDNNHRDVACFCRGASNPAGGLTCVTPTCGSIFCEAWCAFPASGSCVPPEGGDASAEDAGPLCADDAGIFQASPGTCQGQSCAPGCACVSEGNGQAACLCTAANNHAGACIAPTCGTIFCEPGCTCANPTSGRCSCP